MKIAVRYCSTYGNTKAIASEIADELGVEAVSVIDEPELSEPVDLLFLGGAPYWSIMDPKLQDYAERLSPELVGKVVLFTTSNWSRRTALGLRDILERKGIQVEPGHFYAHMTQINNRKPAARAFARAVVVRHETETAPLAQSDLVKEALTVGGMALGVAGAALLIWRLAHK